MKFSSEIVVEGDADNIIRLFEPEEKKFSNNRAQYTIKKEGFKVKFIVNADDGTALRAVLNSIVKNLVVYEKVKKNG
jgi:tRNA threonylcarbamoyladenosine modification (KEOPS) complex  Pcc1 subunit